MLKKNTNSRKYMYIYNENARQQIIRRHIFPFYLINRFSTLNVFTILVILIRL